MAPSLVVNSVADRRCLLSGLGICIAHGSSHQPFPFGAEAPGRFSEPNWYSFERSIWLFGSCTEVILVIWVSPAFVTWFWYWKGSRHFDVPISGHEACEKAKASLKFVRLKIIFSLLEKNSSDLCHTCIHRWWFFYCLILILHICYLCLREISLGIVETWPWKIFTEKTKFFLSLNISKFSGIYWATVMFQAVGAIPSTMYVSQLRLL